MATPTTPYLVSGTTSDSFGNNISDVQIVFTTSQGSDLITSNDSGQYIYDLGNIGYTVGETVTYSAKDKFKNELLSGTFVISGASTTLNLGLEVRTDRATLSANRTVHISNIGGEVVSTDNPFPVIINKIPVGDGSLVLSYNASNLLTKIVKTIKGDTYTRTLGYDSSNNLTSVSEWVKS